MPDPSRSRQIIGIDGLMAVLIFALSLILLVAGAASGYASLDLLPTSDGVLYALAGAVAVCAAVVTFAIGVAIRRIDRLAKLIGQSVSPAPGDITPASETAQAEEVLAAPATEAESTERVAEAVAARGREPDQHQSRRPSALARGDRDVVGDAGRAAEPGRALLLGRGQL